MKAVISLRAAAAAANKLDFVDAPKATILLRGLAANFTEEPSTENQVAELGKYLTDEDLIGEAEEPNWLVIEILLRAPLLAALGGLRRLHEPGTT